MEKNLILSYMTKNPLTIEDNVSIAEALKIMESHNFRHLAVVKDNKPYSILSARDVKLMLAQSGDDMDLNSLQVADFCPLEMISVKPTDLLEDVLEYFISEKIGAVLVKEQNEFVGIFSLIDVCKTLKKITTTKTADL